MDVACADEVEAAVAVEVAEEAEVLEEQDAQCKREEITIIRAVESIHCPVPYH